MFMQYFECNWFLKTRLSPPPLLILPRMYVVLSRLSLILLIWNTPRSSTIMCIDVKCDLSHTTWTGDTEEPCSGPNCMLYSVRQLVQMERSSFYQHLANVTVKLKVVFSKNTIELQLGIKGHPTGMGSLMTITDHQCTEQRMETF